MVWHNKVNWSEGLFLRPQLFQQQERYLERHAHRRCEALGNLFWGFQDLGIETSALGIGRLQLTRARGVWPDGLAFDFPDMGPCPEPLCITPEHVGDVMVLAMPQGIPQAEEVSFEPLGTGRTRYAAFDAELRDVNSTGQGLRSVQLLRQCAHLLPRSRLPESWMELPVARIGAVHADGSVEIDESALAPCTAIAASGVLMRWLGELHAHLGQRAAQLAQRMTGESRAQAADMVDILLLQVLNAAETRLGHLIDLRRVAPERVYEMLRILAAELATYLRPDTRRPHAVPAYSHRELGACFPPLLNQLRELLHGAVRRGAELIELQDQSHGMRVASVDPSVLKQFSALVIAVSADLDQDALIQSFATQAKVGPSDRLAELVRLHLPGIPLRALPVPPRQLPYRADQAHFQLDADGALWQQMLGHGGIGIHMAVEFPGLKLHLWGLR